LNALRDDALLDSDDRALVNGVLISQFLWAENNNRGVVSHISTEARLAIFSECRQNWVQNAVAVKPVHEKGDVLQLLTVGQDGTQLPVFDTDQFSLRVIEFAEAP
jgi:hypothetical protein